MIYAICTQELSSYLHLIMLDYNFVEPCVFEFSIVNLELLNIYHQNYMKKSLNYDEIFLSIHCVR